MRSRNALLICVVAWASTARADAISLKDHQEPVQGRIVEETDDAFVIEVRKDQIARVERSAPFVSRHPAAAPKVLWEERDGYVILQIPQEQVERRRVAGSAGASSPVAALETPPAPAVFTPPIAAPGPAVGPADRRLGGITGQVLWEGKPLANCKVKAVMVSSPQPLAMVAKLLGQPEAQAEEGFVAEAATDASGRYRFDRVPPGEYDLYWQPAGQPSSQWIRRLREQPDLVVLEGEAAAYPGIEAHVKTRN